MIMYPAYTWTDSNPHHATKDMNPNHMNPNPPYQPWSYCGNYPHHVPHGCCNLTYYGGGPYGFNPHYPHYQPPPPPPSFHPHGFYYPFPPAYNPYSVSPQHYSVESPRYDYEKKNHAPHHCCECHHRDDEKMKDESQVDKKTSESLIPFLLKDRPDYPIMWVPREYMNNDDSKAKEMEKYCNDPVSVKHQELLKQDENGEMGQIENGDDGNRFPFQIFWLPSKKDEMKKDIKDNTLDLAANKRLPDEKMIKNNEDESKIGSKNVVQKVIPVKQVGANEEKKSKKVVVNSDSLEKTDNGSRVSQKTSKLPPVCLRIDPLPKKKKSSRSPSPSERDRSNGSPINDLKSSQQQEQFLKKIKEEEKNEDNIKNLDLASKDERDNLADNVPKAKGDESEKEKVKEKKLSEDEAALVVQSVYRGFEVRKSDPLKKLKQIYEVRKQVFELRNRIRDLESFGVDGKKEVIIGETIMSLLLNLDTIQGLHPFVREVRKSVAKELVGLQEKLDSLTSVKSETSITHGHQPVNHPEDDVIIQENSDHAEAQSGLLENHEHEATESQYDNDDDDAEAHNTQNLDQHLEKSNVDEAIQDKFDQVITGSDTVIGEKPEVEVTNECNTTNAIGEPQLESHKEKLDELPTKCEPELEPEAPTERDEATKEKLDELPTKCEPELEPEAPTERDEATELQGNCNEAQSERFDHVPVESDDTREGIGESAIECDDSCKTHTESEEGCNSNTVDESHKGMLDNTNEVEVEGTDCVNNGGVMEVEHKNIEVDEKMQTVSDEAVNAEDSSIKEDVEMVKMDSKLPKEDELEEVIRELRGRVKELENKLAKKKKIKVNNKRRKSRGYVVQKDIVTKA